MVMPGRLHNVGLIRELREESGPATGYIVRSGLEDMLRPQPTCKQKITRRKKRR